MSRLLALGLALIAAPGIRADLRLTVVVRLTNTGVEDLSADAVKDDPAKAARLAKGLDQSPDLALLLGRPVTVVEWFKGDRERVDLGLTTRLTDPPRTLLLDHRRRTVAAVSDGAPQGPNPPDLPVVRDTGRTRTVAGHPTREYALDATSADGTPFTMRIWAAADLPTAPVSANPFVRRMPAAQRAALARVKGVVLRLEVKLPMEGGRLANLVQEATAVSTAPVPLATFAVPKGYRKIP